MKAALVALLLTLPPDAPVNGSPGEARLFAAGDVVPYAAVCLDDVENLRRVKGRERCEATLAEARPQVLLSKPVLVGIIVAAVLVGAAVAVAAVEGAHVIQTGRP